MSGQQKKQIANVRIQLPPETRGQQGYTPFSALSGDGWNVIVPVPDLGFDSARASLARKNRFIPWCSMDLHRYIHRLVSDFNSREPTNAADYYQSVVLPLILQHGSLFNDEELLLSEWRTQLDRIHDIVTVVTAYRDGRLNDEDQGILEKELSSVYEGALAFTLEGVALRPANLADYALLLAARDCWQGISYTLCPGCQLPGRTDPRDWREVPSTSLPTPRFISGRAIKFCGKRCANRSSAATPIKQASERAQGAPRESFGKQQDAEKDLAEALEKLNTMGGTQAVGEELDAALEKLNELEGNNA